MQAGFLSALILALIAVVACVPLAKKSDEINAFASALNGAGRLRYGKRSGYMSMFNDPDTDINDDGFVQPAFSIGEYGPFKRSPNTQSLVETLNGAERLRFGRK
ncbi:unnamed protein product, partial [Mesorhabditis spiculigera]